MVLETLGIGLIIPAISLLAQHDISVKFPELRPWIVMLGNPSHETMIVFVMATLVCVFIVKNLFFLLLVWFQEKFTYDIHIRLSQHLFKLYLSQPYTFHLQRNSSELIRNIYGEVGMFSAFGIAPGMMLISEALILSGICVLLFTVQPLGSVIAGFIMGCTGWIFLRISRKKITEWGEKRQYHNGLIIQHLQQGLNAVKDVKLLGRESEFLERYRIHNIESARVGKWQKILQQLPRLWLEILVVISLSALMFSMLAQGRELEDILPVLGLFAVAAFRLMPSVNRILSAIQSLRYGLTVVDKLNDEVNRLYPDVMPSKQDTLLYKKLLEFERVTYIYPESDRASLKDVSLTIKKGEFIGIIGTSGAGKSTLIDILLGLLTPIEGKVKVDGQDIQGQLRQWQDKIGYVPQSIYLTDDTLRRNIAFGIPNEKIDDDAVLNSIRAAQLDEFIKTLPMGLDTIVGENGIRLSGGQRQRIGIARALYHTPAVLVLDEATSALDMLTEHSLMEAVRALKGQKTIIIVTHRLSTVEYCDRLYQLEDGRLVQVSVPEKILKSN